MELLRRKIDSFLMEWKNNHDRKPLIVKGSRQIGKTESIKKFARENYNNAIIINFVIDKKFTSIFEEGYDVDDIVKNISLINPSWKFISHETLIFFDELQACPQCATSLKAFMMDGRYDVICSGSLMGLNYNEIESNSVGYKEDFEMHSMDFEEFLWAKGYSDAQIEGLYEHLRDMVPFSALELEVLFALFRDYVTIGGMPEVVRTFIANNNFSGTLRLQRQLLHDYEEDITKYAAGLNKAKIKNVYSHISTFLGKENKKFQITKISKSARNREYIGSVEWLTDAGIINPCFCLSTLVLPLKGNYDPKQYKLYFKDTGLLIASLDDESQEDLRANRNMGTYKGAIYENIIGDMLVKQGYKLYFYRDERASLEMDFFIRDAISLVPIEVKASDSSTPSLNRLIGSEKYPDIRFGIKLCYKNLGFNGKFYTIPYFMTFLLRRFLSERQVGQKISVEI